METFLLGECSEELALELEERLFADDAFYRRMQEVKASLIEREVRGTLPVELSSALQAQMRRSPALLAEVERSRASYALSRPAGSPGILIEAFRRLRTQPMFKYSLALLFLVAIGASLLRITFWNSGFRSAPPVESNGRPVEASRPTEKEAKPKVVFLATGVLRGESKTLKLHLLESEQPIELQIEVRDDLQFLRSVTLDRDSAQMFHQEKLEVQTLGQVHFVVADIPAGTLRSGHYELRVIPDPSSPKPGQVREIRSVFEVVE